MKLNLRDLFWLLLVLGLVFALYRSRRDEVQLRSAAVRTDWKIRVQDQFLRNKGVAVTDDGQAITVTADDLKAIVNPHGFQTWTASGQQTTATFPKAPPYSWPPVRK
ncbi:hypothetical protein [Anatilimnocola floriformis]|uniref:hypothetical protein n=1 Tax=Anatilimnocola floriformis TaxID=2948575 RepID=UPI0020C30ABC|nr:hypothetical protein [Anatilimnocola floriformis]